LSDRFSAALSDGDFFLGFFVSLNFFSDLFFSFTFTYSCGRETDAERGCFVFDVVVMAAIKVPIAVS